MKKIYFLFFAVMLLICLAWGMPSVNSWKDKVDESLLQMAYQQAEVEFLVLLEDQAELDEAARLTTKEEKGEYVFQQLRSKALSSQQNLLRILKEQEASYHSFFIINSIFVNGDIDLIRLLAEQEEVANIQPNPHVKLDEPFPNNSAINFRDGVEWGIQKIKADSVWAMGFTGQEVVVGGQDTGVDWDHPAIKNQYRGWNGSVADHNYNWHDAIHAINPLHEDEDPDDPDNNPCGLDTDEPCDDHNHGTHTIGTMVGGDGGDNQIGVAPGARWMACRNMERGYGSPASYIECFEWFLAPTNLADETPDPFMAPHVIANSWSCPELEGCNESNWATMEAVVNNLKAAGIVVVVSAGNSGSNCGSINTPAAMFENSFTVGASHPNDTVAGFSSRGLVTVDGSNRLKPNVVAPGVQVRSAIRNEGYATWNGTSMAGPHVAGLVALIISAKPELAGQVEAIEDIIEQTCRNMLTDQDCGEFSGLEVPNTAYGYGRVNALEAVRQAMGVVRISPIPSVEAIQVYPNPVSTITTFQFQDVKDDFRMNLYNAAGQLVQTQRWVVEAFQTNTLDMTGLPEGVYFYKLEGRKATYTGKLMKR